MLGLDEIAVIQGNCENMGKLVQFNETKHM